jgi:hypothetical protein
MKFEIYSESDRVVVANVVSFAKKLAKNWQFVGLAMLVVAFINPSAETAADYIYKSAKKNNMTGRSLCTRADRIGDVKCYYTVDKFLLSESRTANVFQSSIRRKNLVFASIFQYSSDEIRANLISEAENVIEIGSDYSSYDSSQRSRNPDDFDVCRGRSSINCPIKAEGTIQGRGNPLIVGILGLVFGGEVRVD